MKSKVKYKQLPFFLVIMYPLIDVLYNTVSKDIHNSTLNVLYFSIVVLISVAFNKCLINRKFLICIAMFIIYGLLSYEKSGSILLQFFFFLLITVIFSNSKYMKGFKEYVDKESKIILVCYSAYLLVLLYAIFFKNGIQTGWNTVVVYGPYSLPHTLAYEMLAMMLMVLYLFKRNQRRIWILFTGSFELIIILTCVRSALLVSVVIFFAFSLCFNLKTKFYFMIIGGIFIGVFVYYRVFDQIIEKTLFAISNGSITNGREWIVNSSLTIFKESSVIDKIIGSGYNNLLSGNLRLLGSAIQGHNDLLTVLVSFGIVGLVAYVYYFLSFVRGKGGLFCFLSLFVLVYYNGLFLYSPMVISLGIAKMFFELRELPNRSKKQKKVSIDGKKAISKYNCPSL